jgi:uncharacterized protein (DUF58 family)
MFRRQILVGREGWFYLFLVCVVFGVALSKGVNLLLILASMLLGPVLLNWLAIRSNLRGLRFTRKLPTNVCAGDTLSVGMHLSNPRPRLGCWDVVVEEQIRRIGNGRPHEAPLTPSVFFPYVRAGQRCQASYRGRLLKRGTYQFGPLRVSTRFPFGLFARTIVVQNTQTCVVLPRLGRLTRGWETRRREACAGADRRGGSPGPEGDFYGVREWRHGDQLRLIHWRGSARLDTLVVRQFERPRNRDVALLLDLWEPQPAEEAHRENVELAVSFAATVLTDLSRKGGANVFLALTQEEPRCLGGPVSATLLQNLLEQLATVEAHAQDCLTPLLACAIPRITAGVEIVLVSTRAVDPSDALRLAAANLDPMLRDRFGRIRCVDTSSDELWKYFSAE